jgi:hypothetical protein
VWRGEHSQNSENRRWVRAGYWVVGVGVGGYVSQGGGDHRRGQRVEERNRREVRRRCAATLWLEGESRGGSGRGGGPGSSLTDRRSH